MLDALKKYISEQGYKSDSPDKDRPFNIIPSNRITMKGVNHPVIGKDNLGNIRLMIPGAEYIFPGQYVIETPLKQDGGQWFDDYTDGGIHIKPENRGKFNAYKERTGKTTEEATHSSDPHVRKMAIFAQNAAKWKHQTGGSIEDPPYQWDNTTSNKNVLATPKDYSTSISGRANELARQVMINMMLSSYFSTQDLDKRNQIEQQFESKFGDRPETYLYKNDANYRKNIDQQNRFRSEQFGSINYPIDNPFNKESVAPNNSWMYPNLSGESRANATRFQNEVIQTALPTPLVDKMGKIPSLMGAGKNVFKGTSKVDDVVKNIPIGNNYISKVDNIYTGSTGKNDVKAIFQRPDGSKFIRTVPYEDVEDISTKKNWKVFDPETNEEMFSLANTIRTKEQKIDYAKDLIKKYRKEASDPRNIKKYKKMDAYGKLDDNYEDFFNKYSDYLDKQDVTVDIGKIDIPNARGQSLNMSNNVEKLMDEVWMIKYTEPNISLSDAISKAKKNLSKDRYTLISEDVTIDDYYRLISHEEKHNITNADKLIPEYYKNLINDVFDKTKYNKPINTEKNSFDFDDPNYLTRPTEVQAYLGTNFKDELVDAGYIKSVHDDVPEDLFERKGFWGTSKASNEKLPTLKKYMPFIKDEKKFIKLVNIMPYTIAGGATTYGLTNKKAYGGNLHNNTMRDGGELPKAQLGLMFGKENVSKSSAIEEDINSIDNPAYREYIKNIQNNYGDFIGEKYVPNLEGTEDFNKQYLNCIGGACNYAIKQGLDLNHVIPGNGTFWGSAEKGDIPIKVYANPKQANYEKALDKLMPGDFIGHSHYDPENPSTLWDNEGNIIGKTSHYMPNHSQLVLDVRGEDDNKEIIVLDAFGSEGYKIRKYSYDELSDGGPYGKLFLGRPTSVNGQTLNFDFSNSGATNYSTRPSQEELNNLQIPWWQENEEFLKENPLTANQVSSAKGIADTLSGWKKDFIRATGMGEETYDSLTKIMPGLAFQESDLGLTTSIEGLGHKPIRTIFEQLKTLGKTFSKEGPSRGYFQVRDKMLFNNEDTRRVLRNLGITKKNYDPQNIIHSTMAALTLFDNISKTSYKGFDKAKIVNGKEKFNNPDLPINEKLLYLYNNPSSVRHGDAQGDATYIKNVKDFDYIYPQYSGEQINLNTVDITPGSEEFQAGGLVQSLDNKYLSEYHQTAIPNQLLKAQQGQEVKQRIGVRDNGDGTVSTHLMRAEYVPERGWVGFPSLFQNEDSTWYDMNNVPDENWKQIYEEAVRRGEVYDFGDDKKKALEFGKGSWKKRKGGLVSKLDKKYLPNGEVYKAAEAIDNIKEMISLHTNK